MKKVWLQKLDDSNKPYFVLATENTLEPELGTRLTKKEVLALIEFELGTSEPVCVRIQSHLHF